MAAKKRNKNGTPASGLTIMPWIAGVLFILGIAVLAGLYRERTVVIREIRYEGIEFVDRERLEQRIEVPTGIRPDSLDFLEIIREAEQIDYVRYASVSVEPSGDLVITVTERQPIAMLADGAQKIYVDRDGVRLPIVLGTAVDVPILYGFDAGPMRDTLRSAEWRRARDFLVEMNRRPVSNTTISEVAWTGEEGIVALSHEHGVKLVFGNSDFGRRLRNWEAFYSEIIREKGIRSMQSVDLRFEGQIVTREG